MFRYPTYPKLSASNPALSNLSRDDRQKFCSFGSGPPIKPAHPTILDALLCSTSNYPSLPAAVHVQLDGSLDYENSMSYDQLNQNSDRLAAVLLENGVTNGDRVCIFLKRSIPMLTAIVATLKVGACYVPQHVGPAPPEQLVRVATATQTKVVLTLRTYLSTLPDFGSDVKVIAVDDPSLYDTTGPRTSFTGPHRPVLPSDVCYIIFTSGTTGEPKGVQVTHGNVANIILTEPMSLGLRPGARIAQLLSIGFDMGAWEILGALTHGSTLLIRGRDIQAAARHANVIIATPSVLSTIKPQETPDVETVAVAGEPCPRPLAIQWSKKCRFFNSCGPTEVTIVNTAKLVDANEDGVLTIGSPTPNNTVYVLKPGTLDPCAIGEVGEMWGGGACVSVGYLDNEKLTSERYVADPFVCNDGQLRMYRTGDLGRWNEKGELEHFGRVDDQVKVKGFRVELDGVSSTVEKTEGVKKAVVMKVGEELVAWVCPTDVDEEEVRNKVGAELPYYCVPSMVIKLKELPKTSNGKVDKRGLMEMLEAEMSTSDEESTCAGKPQYVDDMHMTCSELIIGSFSSALVCIQRHLSLKFGNGKAGKLPTAMVQVQP